MPVTEAVGVDVLVCPRVDVRPRTLNVAPELVTDEADGVVFGCLEVRGSILLATLDGAVLAVLRFAVEVDFGVDIRVVTVVGVRPGIMVRETRLLLLFAATEEGRVWTEEERVCELLEATLTVRFTGRERDTLRREELLTDDPAACARELAGRLD